MTRVPMHRLAARSPAGAGPGDAPPPDPPTPPARPRRRGGPVVFALIGAVIAVAAYAIVDSSSGSDSGPAPRAAAPSTSTTAPPAFAAQVYKVIGPSLVFIETAGPGDGDTAIGSGVVINAAGQIMTAYHVVEGASSIKVTFADGTDASAEIVDSTPENDIAVLQPTSPPGLIVPAVLGGGVQIGDDTYAVGNPLGLGGSLSAGVVSGLDRTVTRENGDGDLKGLIQFDAAVNPGSSGGPLTNRAGQVVGIVTALANPTGQRFFSGIGFAVPIGSAGGAARVPDQ